MTDTLFINHVPIKPGERTTVMLEMPKLYDWTPLSVPVHVFRGKEAGPTLCITAAVHGDEVNGIEIIRRLLKKKSLKKISGTLITIPVVNLQGFLNQDRYLTDRRDLNRAFPGSKKGSLAARLAYLISSQILSKSTHIIDLHSGSLHRINLPQIRTDLSIPQAKELAESFNAPVILDAELRDGSMRQYASQRGIPFLLYEAGESLRFDEVSIKTGVNGILRVMQLLGMISMKKPPQKRYTPSIAHYSYWVRASHSGIFKSFKPLGHSIKKGELIAQIGNPTNIEEHDIVSPLSGIIIGRSNIATVHEGAALFHVASFEELDLVAEQIEYLQAVYT